MKNKVSLLHLNDYDIDVVERAVRESFSLHNFPSRLRPKMKVLLKVCLPLGESPDSGKTSHPVVVKAIVNVLNELGVESIIADSPYRSYTQTNLDNVYQNTGMLEVANSARCTLNHDLRTTTLSTPNGVMAKDLTLLKIIDEVDAVINIGKIKIDDRLGYLGASANMFGLVPGDMKTVVLNRLETVADFSHYLVDMIDALKDKLIFNVLDAVVALEANDTAHLLSCLAMGENVFSIDSAMLDILNIEQEKSITHIAIERGFLDPECTYRLVGDSIDLFTQDDFAINDVTIYSDIHKNKGARKRYFDLHQTRPEIKPNKCKGCIICSKVCPNNAIIMKCDKRGELYAHIDYDRCIQCFKCRDACPYNVVKKITPIAYTNLMNQISQYNSDEENK